MSTHRGRRGGVEDRWTKTTRQADGTSTKVPSANHGKGRRWRARYVDDTGQEHSKAFDRKADANTWLDSATSSLVQGSHVAPSAGKATTTEFGHRWLQENGHLKATTDANRRHTWQKHVAPKWGHLPVRDIRASAIRSWVADLVTAGTGVPTIENCLVALRGALDIAVEDKQIALNPCLAVKAPRRGISDRHYLTHTQVEQLAGTVRTHPEVIRFLSYTGLRWGEMAALRVGDFDTLRRRVNVSRGVAEVKGALVWSTPKDHERRGVPYPSILAEELAALMAGKGRDELVFTGAEGAVLRVSTWRPRIMARAVRTIQETDPDFPTLSPHDLRHTAASLAISAGANVKAVQKMLGHAKASMTLDTYADLFPDDLEAVASALDERARAARGSAADSLRTGQQ